MKRVSNGPDAVQSDPLPSAAEAVQRDARSQMAGLADGMTMPNIGADLVRGVMKFFKHSPSKEAIVKGNPAIGLGGGAASSMGSGTSTEDLDFASVQRGNPEIQRRAQQVIDSCWATGLTEALLNRN